ncbi:MAG: PmoA family protein [Bryobacteraceae bacterium]
MKSVTSPMRLAPLLAACAFLALPLCAQVKIAQRGGDRIIVDINGKPFTELIIGSDAYKPYLYPVRSASGKAITRHYPMETYPGESHDHPHHRGLFFAHGDVNGVDFWGNDPIHPSPNGGKIVVKHIDDLKSGKKSGSITATFDWDDRSGKAILTEHRVMTFYSERDARTMDFDITLTPNEKAVFGDTKEGTFAIRLATALQADGRHTGHIVDAEGATGEENVWGKKSNWVDYYGELDGEKLGVAIFDHPDNPGHPVRWHVRGYGLFAANPFGLADFVHDKSQKGGLTIEPGQSLRFRYRVVVHSGDVTSAHIAELYKKYAATVK